MNKINTPNPISWNIGNPEGKAYYPFKNIKLKNLAPGLNGGELRKEHTPPP